VSYARFASPHQRLKPITRRPNPQVPTGLHSRGGSLVSEPHSVAGLVYRGKVNPPTKLRSEQ